MNFDVTQATEKGRRDYQEDRKVVYWSPGGNGYLLAVFDGHGGSECANYCAERLIALSHEVKSSSNCLEASFRSLFHYLSDETEYMGSGCAASLAFIPADGRYVIIGVLGDAPVLVKKADGEVWLAPEHNVRSNRAEADAAIARGGFVQSGYLFTRLSGSGLQMSRALGDRYLGPVLNREPEVFTLPTGPGSFVLVASDGLFDPSHETNPSVGIAQAIEAGVDASKLVEAALAIPTYDNVTAILVKFSQD